MAVTSILDVADQIQKYWSPRFTAELRESLLLGALVDKSTTGRFFAKAILFASRKSTLLTASF